MGKTYRYWPELLRILKWLCRFLKDHKSKLPADLPANVKALILLAEIACEELDAYDKANSGGGPK